MHKRGSSGLHQPVRMHVPLLRAFRFPPKPSTVEALGGLAVYVCVTFLSRAGHGSQVLPLRVWAGLVWSVAPARWLHPYFPEMFASHTPGHGALGHGLARQSELVRPSAHARGVSPGLGDPGPAPAAGAAGPAAPGPGKAPDRGDPWRTHGVPAPAEAQALGGHRLGRGPGAAALDPGRRHADPRVGKEGTPGGARLCGPRTTSSYGARVGSRGSRSGCSCEIWRAAPHKLGLKTGY